MEYFERNPKQMSTANLTESFLECLVIFLLWHLIRIFMRHCVDCEGGTSTPALRRGHARLGEKKIKRVSQKVWSLTQFGLSQISDNQMETGGAIGLGIRFAKRRTKRALISLNRQSEDCNYSPNANSLKLC